MVAIQNFYKDRRAGFIGEMTDSVRERGADDVAKGSNLGNWSDGVVLTERRSNPKSHSPDP